MIAALYENWEKLVKYFFLYAAIYTKLSVSNRNIFVDAHRHCVRHFRVRPEAEAGF